MLITSYKSIMKYLNSHFDHFITNYVCIILYFIIQLLVTLYPALLNANNKTCILRGQIKIRLGMTCLLLYSNPALQVPINHTLLLVVPFECTFLVCSKYQSLNISKVHINVPYSYGAFTNYVDKMRYLVGSGSMQIFRQNSKGIQKWSIMGKILSTQFVNAP